MINVKHLILIILTLFWGLSVSACSGQDTTPEIVANPEGYGSIPATRDGIGKTYMGREIAQVMGHLGAGWLERPSRVQEERTDLLIDNLPLSSDSVVADIGAGTGYFSFPIAERVPDGKVLAVDIQQEMLDIIEDLKIQKNANNVITVLGTESDPKLEPNTVDVVLIVDAYHEFSYPKEMGEAIKQALKPGGQLVLIEYREEDPFVSIKSLHKMSQPQVKREMAAIGLKWVRTDDLLPQQHFLVFQKPDEQPPPAS